MQVLTPDDVAVRAEALRCQLASLRKRHAELKARKTIVDAEAAAALERERRAYEHLVDAEEDALRLSFQAMHRQRERSTVDIIAAALREYASQCQLFLVDEQRQLEYTREAVSKEQEDIARVVNEVHDQLNTHRSMQASWEQEARRQRSEVLRLQQERLELEARAEATLLRHGRELFSVLR